jgi:uncharacterized protein YyaL (SSP411 family)
MHMQMLTAITQAILWLTHSGIRNGDESLQSFGGLNAGYDWKRKTYTSVYNEITGYGISSFLNLYQWTGDPHSLDLARDAADYLCRFQVQDPQRRESGAIPHSLTQPDMEVVRTYWSFDNAMILRGLMKLHALTHEASYLSAGVGIADWLLRHMQRQDGSFTACYDGETDCASHEKIEFYGDGGCLHVKNALGLLSLAAVQHDERYAGAARRLCHWGLELQNPDGTFWANGRKRYVFTHAHCYATEGYLYAYHCLKDPEFLAAGRLAGEALVRLQNGDGSLYRIYRNRLPWKERAKETLFPQKTSDATAQAIRIWVLLYYLTREKQFLQAAEKAVRFLLEMQVGMSADPRQNGAFYYQRCDLFGKKRVSPVLFTWCAQFGTAALYAFAHVERENGYDRMMDELF